MQIVKPNAELMKHDINLYKFIEKVGRICYKSEDKITEDSAKNFVTGLARSNHYAPIEHEYIYFQFEDIRDVIGFISQCIIPDNHSYNLTRYLNITNYFITGNVRAWIEFFDNIYNLSQKYEIGIGMYETMHWMLNTKYPDLFPLYSGWNYSEEEVGGDPIGVIGLIGRQAFIEAAKEFDGTDTILKTGLAHTIKFTIDRSVSHELVRHRPASFAQSSTRYCDYSKSKYCSELTFIKPCFFENINEDTAWYKVCKTAEDAYLNMRDNGVKPEEARSVLPNSLMTELIVTATEEEWQHIIDLRYHGVTGTPHPQMKEVMGIAYPILVKESEGRIK